MNSVLLTVDLTKAVVDEAIERNDSIIVAYRMFRTALLHAATADINQSIDPIIFKGLKSLTLADSQQQSLLRLAAEGISVWITMLSQRSCSCYCLGLQSTHGY